MSMKPLTFTGPALVALIREVDFSVSGDCDRIALRDRTLDQNLGVEPAVARMLSMVHTAEIAVIKAAGNRLAR